MSGSHRRVLGLLLLEALAILSVSSLAAFTPNVWTWAEDVTFSQSHRILAISMWLARRKPRESAQILL